MLGEETINQRMRRLVYQFRSEKNLLFRSIDLLDHDF